MNRTIPAIPHVRSVSLERQTLQQLICDRLHWPEQAYCDFQFEAGYVFLDTPSLWLSDAEKKQMPYSAMFWGWWRNQWLTRDEAAYRQLLLTPACYRRQNTRDVLSTQLIASFWSRLGMMLADGQARLAHIEKEEADADS